MTFVCAMLTHHCVQRFLRFLWVLPHFVGVSVVLLIKFCFLALTSGGCLPVLVDCMYLLVWQLYSGLIF